MNVMHSATTKASEKAMADWKSKTDKGKRYEKCVKCGILVLDNWILRHVKKCVEGDPKATELYDQAIKNHTSKLAAPPDVIEDAAAPPPPPVVKQNTEDYITELDKKLVQPTITDNRLLNSYHKYAFKFGDQVEAIVTTIDPHAVYVNYINGNKEKTGMIKITKARPTSISDLKAHFRVGDKIKAEVIEIRANGTLGLSTKKSYLPTYPVDSFKNNMSEKLEPLKEQLMTTSEIVLKDERQLEEVLAFIKSKIGLVSPEARAKIQGMLENKGMFTFMMALAKAADVQMDVGLVFAAEIEKQMGNRPC